MSHRILAISLALLCSFLCSFLCANAQGVRTSKPRWVGNPPRTEYSTFYFVEVSSDMASSLAGARTSALEQLSANVARTDNIAVSEIYTDKSQQRYSSSSGVRGTGTDSYMFELHADGTAEPIHSRRIDEYWTPVQRGGMNILEYHAIYAVERKGQQADFSHISVTNRYGMNGLWRSAIVPGWGQFHKGAVLKGSLILGGCAVLAGGIVFCDNQRSDYSRKIAGTHDASLIRSYATKRDHFATARNVCIGAVAALYAYNLIDAVAAAGARRLVIDNGKYSVAPGVSPFGTPVVAASVKF